LPKFTRKTFVSYWLPLVIWLAVIFTESVSPFAAADRTSRLIIPVIHWLMPSLNAHQVAELHHFIRKVGHFTGYGLLSYFFFRALRATYHVHQGTENCLKRAYRSSGAALVFSDYWRLGWASQALLATIIVASLDEMHQMTLRNRTGTWWDVLLDSVGALVFQVLIVTFIGIRVRARKGAPVRVGA
jgi:VanZ family protein